MKSYLYLDILPFEGGDVRHMSLNYINRDIADQYQLAGATKKAKEGDNSE